MARCVLLLALVMLSLSVDVQCRSRCTGTGGFLQSGGNVTVAYDRGVGYSFRTVNTNGGCRGERALVIVPDEGVAPEAYASYAQGVLFGQAGWLVVIVEKPLSKLVLSVMRREAAVVDYWAFAGHGKGGEVAAELVYALQPKVRALVLLGAALPVDIDLSSENVLVTSVSFGNKSDCIVADNSITDSFSRLPGDAGIISLPDLNHFDFVDTLVPDSCNYWQSFCNRSLPSSPAAVNATILAKSRIRVSLLLSVLLANWREPTVKALSYGDNKKLTPGQNDSKPYPGDIRVNFSAVPIPNTSPQRTWSVFTPSKVKGGFIYYGGAAVDPRAYWPLAFEIAARGYLVVIPQQIMRDGFTNFMDASVIINSTLRAFSGVAKSRWAVGGHSNGGIGASSYAATYSDTVFAGVLHSGLWVVNMSTNPLPMASIYGTLDDTIRGYQSWKTLALPYVNLAVTKFITILQGNHGQVGDYGAQVCDGIATISLEDEHSRIAQETVQFLDSASPQT